MMKNKLFKPENNQSTKQTIIKGGYSEYTNKILTLYLYKRNNFIATNCYHLLKNIGTVKVKI